MRLLFFLAAWLSSAVALACPACARDNSPWSSVIIGGMLSVPYLVSIAVVRAVRRADRDQEDQS